MKLRQQKLQVYQLSAWYQPMKVGLQVLFTEFCLKWVEEKQICENVGKFKKVGCGQTV